MNQVLVADYNITEYAAGAEMVDDNICKELNIENIKASNIKALDPNTMYIMSNALFINPEIKKELISLGNYVIMEHDYKIHATRQPHRYEQGIFPKNELINLDYYAAAKKVFLQSNDQLDCFKANGVQANFEVLPCSIWSIEELEELHQLRNDNYKKLPICAIIGNTTPDKGRDLAEKWCQSLGLRYNIIDSGGKYYFYKTLATYSNLVYLPRVRESFCRLVIEAKLLNINVFTNRTYGVTKEEWYPKYNGGELQNFLIEGTKEGIKKIKKVWNNI